jgi:hypothetical protein
MTLAEHLAELEHRTAGEVLRISEEKERDRQIWKKEKELYESQIRELMGLMEESNKKSDQLALKN